MENDLTKWKSVWQKQKSKPMQLNKIINRLNKLEQKAKSQRILLILAGSVLIITSIVRSHELLEQKFNVLAYLLVFAAIVVKLTPNLKGKFHLISNEAEFNNLEFINKLEERLKFDAKRLLLFLILAISGLNVALLGLYEKGTIFNFDFNSENRIFIHFCIILLFIVGYIINRKRLINQQNEISNLITELKEDN